MGRGVGLSHPSLQLTFSRRWAAACGNKRGREPGGPGAAPAPTPRTQGRTHRNLVCWSLCEPAICLYTSFSCQARAGMRLGPRGTQFPEDLPRLAGLPAPPPHRPRGHAHGLIPARNRSEGTDPRRLHSRRMSKEAPVPREHPGPTALARGSPPTRSRPGPERPLPLRSPPPPGAAGHIPACQASAGSRCRGGRGAGTARRALGARGRSR